MSGGHGALLVSPDADPGGQCGQAMTDAARRLTIHGTRAAVRLPDVVPVPVLGRPDAPCGRRRA